MWIKVNYDIVWLFASNDIILIYFVFYSKNKVSMVSNCSSKFINHKNLKTMKAHGLFLALEISLTLLCLLTCNFVFGASICQNAAFIMSHWPIDRSSVCSQMVSIPDHLYNRSSEQLKKRFCSFCKCKDIWHFLWIYLHTVERSQADKRACIVKVDM